MKSEQLTELLYQALETEKFQSLGMKAVIPPPEEEKDVKTAIGAARAKQARTEML